VLLHAIRNDVYSEINAVASPHRIGDTRSDHDGRIGRQGQSREAPTRPQERSLCHAIQQTAYWGEALTASHPVPDHDDGLPRQPCSKQERPRVLRAMHENDIRAPSDAYSQEDRRGEISE
jgi:hypothetical protein